MPRRHTGATNLADIERLTRERDEALEREKASAEVLRIISTSPGELKPIFQAMLENAVRICEAVFGNLYLRDADGFHMVAAHHDSPAYVAARMSDPLLRPPPDAPLGRLAITKEVVQVADIRTLPSRDHPFVAPGVKSGYRTVLAIPLLKHDELIGAFTLIRQKVQTFTEKEIALLQNFAAQAVIAIENTRLLSELRQRTADLTESVEEQTATSEVLRVISSSPGELKSVFENMLQNAVRICEARFGTLVTYENGMFREVALCNPPAEFVRVRSTDSVFPPPPGGTLRQIVETKQLVHIEDLAANLSQTKKDETARPLIELIELADARTMVAAPMLREDKLVGAIGIYRQEVRLFTDKQIALLQNFAAQAVIAIENARLLSELRQRTAEVVKLNQQLEQRVSDQVGEIERMGRLRRFLPPQVADLIVASGTEKQLESHRREITALFCDLRGFTGFSESSDPEDVIALLRDYHAAISQIIVKYSGTLERFAGDGVMVIFNDPVPVENPALQAVLMALDMRSAIGGMIEKWRDLGHELGFGIGIAHGFATLGTIGFEGRFDYAAIGTVSNVASRLCDEAKPGQILISPRVRSAVDKAVAVEPVGEFTLTGIRRPMMTYNVLESLPSKLKSLKLWRAEIEWSCGVSACFQLSFAKRGLVAILALELPSRSHRKPCPSSRLQKKCKSDLIPKLRRWIEQRGGSRNFSQLLRRSIALLLAR